MPPALCQIVESSTHALADSKAYLARGGASGPATSFSEHGVQNQSCIKPAVEVVHHTGRLSLLQQAAVGPALGEKNMMREVARTGKCLQARF